MFERENLIWEYADDLDPDEKVYPIEQANAVMDAMEKRIKELEAELRKQKAWENYTVSDNGWL